VTDNGVGISSADLSHVCERFYRADRSRSTPGTGLGLSLVQSIVRAHTGDLQIVSDETAGTQVTIRLNARVNKRIVA
jgi:signal transduction histidine kinase